LLKGKREYIKLLNENLYTWVYEHRFDKRTTKQEIISAYDEFCSKINIEEINKSIRIAH
jgi:hypothetical protein